MLTGNNLRKQAPKHSGSYNADFKHHEKWFVYGLILKDQSNRELAVKIGYSNDPDQRLKPYRMAIAEEVTGLRWELGFKQPTTSEENARIVEEAILAKYSTLPSNGEIIPGGRSTEILTEIGMQMRNLKSL